MKPTILIENLILVGHRKNYITPFNPGVNIIYGDADTGKSSILELINYLLGSKKLNLYEEIQSSVKYAVLELKLNNESVCVKRDIFSPSSLVEVYDGSFDEIEDLTPDKYHPTFKGADDAYKPFSDFLLESLGLPKIMTKVSPSKADSGMARFSFRDLFKYCYVDQDDLGSKRFLDAGNYVVETKNRQTFKYIFNILDSQISEIEAEISELSKEKKKGEMSLTSVSKFLKDFGLEALGNIGSLLDETTEEIRGIEIHLANIRSRMTSDDDVYRALRDNYLDLSTLVKDEEEKLENIYSAIQRYVRLKNDYQVDVDKFKSAQKAKQVIGKDAVLIAQCPLCESKMNSEALRPFFEISDSDRVTYELSSLQRRIRELDSLVKEQRNAASEGEGELSRLISERQAAKRLLDDNAERFISPYISERDGFVAQLAALRQKQEELRSRKRMRKQHEHLCSKIVSCQANLNGLKEKLKLLQENAPSESGILHSLGTELRSYMSLVKIKNPTGIKISDKKYLPIVRDTDYQEINSGGLRTITTIGYLGSIMSMTIASELNIPPFLLIDTVGKYLGKTKESYLQETSRSEDESEEMSDPSKYKNIYEYLIGLSERFDEDGLICQMILVDNDVPPEIKKEYEGFVVAHFSSDGAGGLPVGLIDDVDSI